VTTGDLLKIAAEPTNPHIFSLPTDQPETNRKEKG
jgi:hypothetical protein